MLIYSVIMISAKSIEKWIISFALFSLILSFCFMAARKLIHVYLSGYHGNIFCFPFLIEKADRISQLVSTVEGSFVSVYLLLLLVCVTGLVVLIALLSRQDQMLDDHNRTARSGKKKSIDMLCIFLVLLIFSKLPLLIAQIVTLVRITVAPQVYIWLMVTSISIWPICYPFISLSKKISAHCSR